MFIFSSVLTSHQPLFASLTDRDSMGDYGDQVRKIFELPCLPDSSSQKLETLDWNSSFIAAPPPRGKRDGVNGHISERENVNWMKIIA